MKGIKNIKALCIALAMTLAFTMVNDAQAQCESSVSAKAVIVSETSGEVLVEITTNESFVCKLNILSGKGTEEVEQQSKSGNASLKFTNVDISKIYQVDVEFTTEENKLCKRLQRNDLIFELE